MPIVRVPFLKRLPGLTGAELRRAAAERRAELLADCRLADAALALHDTMFTRGTFETDDGPLDDYYNPDDVTTRGKTTNAEPIIPVTQTK